MERISVKERLPEKNQNCLDNFYDCSFSTADVQEVKQMLRLGAGKGALMRKHPGTCEMRADGYPDCAECFKDWLGMEAEG